MHWGSIDVHGLVGHGAEANGYVFIPALFDFLPGVADHPDDAFDVPLDFDGVALWIRARIPSVFGVRPIRHHPHDGCVVDFPIVAVPRGGQPSSSVPFVCTESFNECAFLFPQTVASHVRSRVVEDFWTALLTEPLECCEFADWIYDCEEGPSLVGFDRRLGFDAIWCGDGDYVSWPSTYDPHVLPLPDEVLACLECAGAGEESFFPAGEPCETCGGVGHVKWFPAWTPSDESDDS